MNRQNVGIVILFLCALGIWRFFSPDEQITAPASTEYQPDFTAEVLRSVEFSIEGKIIRRIFADSMEHYGELGMTMFTNPVIILYDENAQATWKIQAKEGNFSSEDVATLRNNVVIKNMAKNDYIDVITTSYLQLELATNLVRSDQLITITGDLFNQTGIGLEGDLKQEYMTILKQVKAIYTNDEKI
ncbi:LPS export ABC transporter periplasmic protein LptC [Moritella dasanensis]|uniref:LPS export ABC transporter periplasmic protein LptC n=1 Tax=Moritella dasanensis TaxID=428031 RepID=UPI0002FC4D64|nr:LPS export ABC transporter periplasmic protein LptC [Moritella dasanensis]